MGISNKKIAEHKWLKDMRQDEYFPNFLIDKLEAIMLEVCYKIEDKEPNDLSALYKLTNEAVEVINDLQQDFADNDSEIETVARDSIGMDFYFIAQSYGFDNADVEDLIANRDW